MNNDQARQKYPVGIDLGTTNSTIAYVDENGKPQALRNSLGQEITPSALLFEDGQIIVGSEAIKSSASVPESFIDCFKRMMGNNRLKKTINDVAIPPEICSGMLLLNLKKEAESHIGPIHQVVISVPAFFDEGRRHATQIAGKLAGLDVLDIINEPTAAAISHAYRNIDVSDDSEKRTEKKYLVYDLGGGTFDVTILRVIGDSFQTIATDGDVYLGGKDFDERLVSHLAETFQQEHGFDPREDPSDHAQLWLDAEEIKKTLSSRKAFLHTMFCRGIRHRIEMSRDTFEDLTIDLLNRTRTTTNLVLKQAKLGWEDIDEIVLAGGSSRMPAVTEMLNQVSGKKVNPSTNADLMIGFGAALYASILHGRNEENKAGPDIKLVNVNSHSLGVIGIDRKARKKINRIVIPKNTNLPASVTRKFVTAKTGQKSVVVSVVEGESSNPADGIQLGSCKVSDLPEGLPSGSEVIVEFNYLADGTVTVAARLPATRQSASVTIERTRSEDFGNLSDWIKRLTGGSDEYLDEQEKQQRLDERLKALGKKVLGQASAQTNDQAQSLLSEVEKLRKSEDEIKKLLKSPGMDLNKKIATQSKLAQITNRIKSLNSDLEYHYMAAGRRIAFAKEIPTVFEAEVDKIRKLVS